MAPQLEGIPGEPPTAGAAETSCPPWRALSLNPPRQHVVERVLVLGSDAPRALPSMPGGHH